MHSVVLEMKLEDHIQCLLHVVYARNGWWYLLYSSARQKKFSLLSAILGHTDWVTWLFHYAPWV